MTSRWMRLGLLLALIVPAAGCDQAAKGLARTHLALGPPVEALGGGMLFTYAENPGVALSIGHSIPEPYRTWLVTFGVGLVLALVFVAALWQSTLSRAELVGFGLVLGGGIGNLIDRIANDGRVVDFAVVALGPLKTAVFNGADVLIFAGVLVLLALHLRPRRAPQALDPAA